MALRPINLTQFIFNITPLIDMGEHSDVSPEDIQRRVETDELMPWLRARFVGGIDLSLLTVEDRDTELNEEFKRTLAVHGPGDFGVQRSGLCLLIAWTIKLLEVEILNQQRATGEPAKLWGGPKLQDDK